MRGRHTGAVRLRAPAVLLLAAGAAVALVAPSTAQAPARAHAEARVAAGDLGTVGRGAGPDGLPDPLRGRIALGLEGLGLAEEPPPLGVELESPVDERRILALADGAVPDDVRLVAQPLQSDTHAAAARSRSMTKPGSSSWSSQPARGPLARSRKAV